ncbi:MAG: hypothetical protein FWE44_01350 [Defluviitaleaceae bacterium]|nr:hypothetical protein [Defluviitaleaceae bacterium]
MKNWDEILSLYIDDELDEQQKAELEAKLAAEPVLRAKYENLLSVTQTLKSLPEVDLPFGLHEKIMNSTKTASKRTTKPFVRRVAGYGTAVAAALLVALYFVIGNSNNLLSPEPEAFASLEASLADDEIYITQADTLPITARNFDDTYAFGGDFDEADQAEVFESERSDLAELLMATALADALGSELVAEVVAEGIAELIADVELIATNALGMLEQTEVLRNQYNVSNLIVISVNDLQGALSLMGALPMNVLNAEHNEEYSIITVSYENIDFDLIFELLSVFAGDSVENMLNFEELRNSTEDFTILLTNAE